MYLKCLKNIGHSFTKIQKKNSITILLCWKNLNINNTAEIAIHSFHFYPCFLLFFLPFLCSSESLFWYCSLVKDVFFTYVYIFVFIFLQYTVASKFIIYSRFYMSVTLSVFSFLPLKPFVPALDLHFFYRPLVICW